MAESGKKDLVGIESNGDFIIDCIQMGYLACLYFESIGHIFGRDQDLPW